MTPPTMRQIAEAVAARYGLTLDDLKSRSRLKPFSWPRQEAMAAIHATGRYSYARIGQLLGRHHTVVMHAVKVVQTRSPEQRAMPPLNWRERDPHRKALTDADARAETICRERRCMKAQAREPKPLEAA